MSKTTMIGLVLSVMMGVSCVWAQENAGGDEKAEGTPQEQMPRRIGHGLAGKVTAVNKDVLELKMSNGQSERVKVSDKTEYRKDGQPAKLSDFKVGDMVFVRGNPAGDGVFQAAAIGTRSGGGALFGNFREGLGKQFIIGEIKAIQGTQLTVLRPDGVSQTITVDDSTSFRKERESITLADFKVGDHVFGRGEVKNGSFTPTMLNLGEPRFRGGRGPNNPQ